MRICRPKRERMSRMLRRIADVMCKKLLLHLQAKIIPIDQNPNEEGNKNVYFTR